MNNYCLSHHCRLHHAALAVICSAMPSLTHKLVDANHTMLGKHNAVQVLMHCFSRLVIWCKLQIVFLKSSAIASFACMGISSTFVLKSAWQCHGNFQARKTTMTSPYSPRHRQHPAQMTPHPQLQVKRRANQQSHLSMLHCRKMGNCIATLIIGSIGATSCSRASPQNQIKHTHLAKGFAPPCKAAAHPCPCAGTGVWWRHVLLHDLPPEIAASMGFVCRNNNRT